MKIYLAARFSRKNELAGYAAIIENHGHTVTSRWLTGAHDASSERELTHQELRETREKARHFSGGMNRSICDRICLWNKTTDTSMDQLVEYSTTLYGYRDEGEKSLSAPLRRGWEN